MQEALIGAWHLKTLENEIHLSFTRDYTFSEMVINITSEDGGNVETNKFKTYKLIDDRIVVDDVAFAQILSIDDVSLKLKHIPSENIVVWIKRLS
jgi:hypothetical protein